MSISCDIEIRWAQAVKPVGLAWDETPIDPEKLPPDGSYSPSPGMSVLCVPAQFQPAEAIPEDVIGVALRLAHASEKAHTIGLRLAVEEFCARYGPLGVSERFRGLHGGTVEGESLARWSQESGAVRTVVYLLRSLGLLKGARKSWWLSLMADPVHEIELYEQFIAPARAAARELAAEATANQRRAVERRAEQRVRREHAAATHASAAGRLRDLVNAGLERCGVRLMVAGDQAPLRVVHDASTLIARIWLRMALAASARTNLGACENCGEVLVSVGERKRETMRSDRRTCSPRCRQQLSRKRKAKQSKGTTKRRHDGTPAKRT